MKNRCVIVAGGDCKDLSVINENDFLIAADSGLNVLLKNNITPSLIVGDFDSFDGELPSNVETIVLPTHKDDTDLLYAAKIGVERGFSTFLILGGYGSRPDQNYAMYETLLWLKRNEAVTNVKALCTDFYVTIILNESVELDLEINQYLSVFAFGGVADRVSVTGTEYELNDYTLKPGVPIGVSNEISNSGKISISVKNGALLVFVVNKNI